MITPFEMSFDQQMVEDLNRRLGAVRWNDAVATSKGGHFPAWEAPDLYANDLRRHVAESSV